MVSVSRSPVALDDQIPPPVPAHRARARYIARYSTLVRTGSSGASSPIG